MRLDAIGQIGLPKKLDQMEAKEPRFATAIDVDAVCVYSTVYKSNFTKFNNVLDDRSRDVVIFRLNIFSDNQPILNQYGSPSIAKAF